jgi:Flp pilus assembly protein CpaB
MKSRSLVVAGALVLALLATAGVFLYVSNVKHEAETGGTLATVLVSSTDIPTGTALSDLVDSGAFVTEQVPSDALVQGAVTSPGQLRNRTTAAAILAGEQIPLSRLSDTNEALPGGTLGLQQGYQGVTVKLEAQQMVGPKLQVGDHVTTYGVFTDITAASAPLSSLFGHGGGSTSGAGGTLPSVAAVVVPDARVVAVSTQPLDPSATTSSQDQVTANQLVTLELTPQDAQKVALTQDTGRVWLGLLRPGDRIPNTGPVTLAEVIGR